MRETKFTASALNVAKNSTPFERSLTLGVFQCRMGESGDGKLSPDLVALWDVPLQSGVHSIEFEHGTTTGKRIIRVNGKEILHRDWMFKLVGHEEFTINSSKFKIRVDPHGIFAYRYSLEVNGKPFRDFVDIQSKILKTWMIRGVDGSECRIVLEKTTLDIWVNGEKVEHESEFVDGGNRAHFQALNAPVTLHALKTGVKKQPILYSLTFNGEEIEEARE